jgi:hypothetical protein
VVEQLLNRKTLPGRGRTYYLVQWQGHDSAEDSWEPAEHLAHCPELVAEYAAAAPSHPKARLAAAAKAPQLADPRPARPQQVPGTPTAPVAPTSWAMSLAGPPVL